MPRSKKVVFTLLAIALIGVVAVGIPELGLRLAGYGRPTSFFIPLRTPEGEFLVDNNKFGLSFFDAEAARTPAPVIFPAKKPAGTYRIFVFGESAALGDPRPAYGAGRFLQVLLSEKYPECHFEVIPAAMTAVNSHTLLPIARECAHLEGDLWIIYAGNNELIGPFGAAGVFGQRTPPLSYVRLVLAIQRTRLGQLLMATAGRLARRSKPSEGWSGMQAFLHHRIPPGDPSRDAAYRNFGENLQDILRVAERAGVPVILNTVAVNLTDCAPLASEARTNLPSAEQATLERLTAEAGDARTRGDWPGAAERYRAAAALDPLSANLQFRLGECALRTTNRSAARKFLVNSCDLDALPFRATSPINQVIRQAVQGRASAGLAFFDAEEFSATNSPSGVPGREFFYEHVHFTPEGNYQLALNWARLATSFLPNSMKDQASAGWASQDLCDRRLGLTDFSRYSALEEVLGRLLQPPFLDQLNHSERIEAIRTQMTGIRQGVSKLPSAQLRGIYEEAIRRSPHDFRLHENYADYLEETGKQAEALAEWEKVREAIPHHYFAWYRCGRILRVQGQLEAAEAAFRHALQLRPDFAPILLQLGMIHTVQDKADLAVAEYEQARRLTPADAQVYALLGRAQVQLKRRPEAIRNLREAARLDPSFLDARCALGEELMNDGQFAQARAEFEALVRSRPDFPTGHLGLGMTLLKQGQIEGALKEFEETLRLDPGNQAAQQLTAQLRAKRPAR